MRFSNYFYGTVHVRRSRYDRSSRTAVDIVVCSQAQEVTLLLILERRSQTGSIKELERAIRGRDRVPRTRSRHRRDLVGVPSNGEVGCTRVGRRGSDKVADVTGAELGVDQIVFVSNGVKNALMEENSA